jgi:glycosyltransferase involved in cell wall biosynthesis
MKIAICCINALGWATVRRRWQQMFGAETNAEVRFFYPESYLSGLPALGFRTFRRVLRMRRAVSDAISWGADRVIVATNGEATLLSPKWASKLLIYGDASHQQLSELYKFERSNRKNVQRARVVSRLASNGARMVAMSNWAAAGFSRDYHCDASVLPPAIDTELFVPPLERSHQERTKILFVGGDFERKGGQLIVDALELLPSCELHCITGGDAPNHPRIHHLGRMPNDSPELVRAYQSCDIFCLPTSADCYSHVAIEAQACGLPVLIHPTGGIADITQSGRCAIEIEPTLDSVVAGVRRILDHPQESGQLVSQARQRVLAENAIDVHRERLLTLLQ